MKAKQIWLPEPMMDLEGNSFMRIENYLGIQEFTDQRLKLKTKGLIYEIQGKGLRIRGVTKREIFIEGEIEALHLTREAEQ